MKTKLLLAIVLGVVLLFSLTGCLSKTAITAEDFKTKMEGMGYTVVDSTSQFDDSDLTRLYLAIDPTGSFQLEFFELTTSEYAHSSFELNVTNMKENEGTMSSSTSLTGLNYEKATQTSNGDFWLVSRVENTFIYAHSSESNKDAIVKAVNALGY